MVGNRRETITYSKRTMICLCLLVSTVIAYLYFLNLSVVEVVVRTEHIHAQRDINADIARLETQYIAAQHAVASRIATLEGYDLNTAKVFVSRGQDGLVLSSN